MPILTCIFIQKKRFFMPATPRIYCKNQHKTTNSTKSIFQELSQKHHLSSSLFHPKTSRNASKTLPENHLENEHGFFMISAPFWLPFWLPKITKFQIIKQNTQKLAKNTQKLTKKSTDATKYSRNALFGP